MMDEPTTSVEVELRGGPLDGQRHAVPRRRGVLPREVTAKDVEQPTLRVIEHRYELAADVGPVARYDYAGATSS